MYYILYNDVTLSSGITLKDAFNKVFKIEIVENKYIGKMAVDGHTLEKLSFDVKIVYKTITIYTVKHSYSDDWSKKEIEKDILKSITYMLKHIKNIKFLKGL